MATRTWEVWTYHSSPPRALLVAIPHHITFKICLTTYCCLHVLAPDYFKSVCIPVCTISGRANLRSASLASCKFLTQKQIIVETGASALVARANGIYFPPELCDVRPSLPAFMSHLKTHLFKCLWWWCSHAPMSLFYIFGRNINDSHYYYNYYY